jgi:hypothetical protein
MGVVRNWKYGIQVSAWGAVVYDIEDVTKLERDTLARFRATGLPNVGIRKEMVSIEGWGRGGQESVVIQEQLEGGGLGTVVLRIARRAAKNVEIDWRLFEKNTKVDTLWGIGQATLMTVGIVLLTLGGLVALMGLCLIPLYGIGVVVDFLSAIFCIPGFVMVGAAAGWFAVGQLNTTAYVSEQFASRRLIIDVDKALMDTLVSFGVDLERYRVTTPTDIHGMGLLSTTKPFGDEF